MLSLGSLGGGVRFAFTTRLGGVSASPYDELNLSPDVGDDPVAVDHNRHSVLSRLGVDEATWLRAEHGRRVRIVGDGGAGSGIGGAVGGGAGGVVVDADGLVTTSGVALGALSADCALVVLADPVAGVVGCAHCGRAGLVAGIIEAVVEAMQARGAQSIRAAVGPTICGSCYQVSAQLAATVTAVVPAARSRARRGGAALDVRAGVLDQLATAGVQVVRLVGGCTLEDPTLFSYRRDHLTGRMGALVWQQK